MTPEQLLEIIKRPEGPKLEFKSEVKLKGDRPEDVDAALWRDYMDCQRDVFIRDVLSVTNGAYGTASETGRLIVGIKDENSVAPGENRICDVGFLNLSTKKINDLVNAACEPDIPHIGCEGVTVDGKVVWVITIRPSHSVHQTGRKLTISHDERRDGHGVLKHFKKREYPPGTVFFRQGETVKEANHAERTNLTIEKQLFVSNPPPVASEPPSNPPLPVVLPQVREDPIDLEPELMRLVGREKEIAQWHELLRDPATRLLRLTGPGGIGKTRAALAVAWRCAQTYNKDFPDGVKWIRLSDTHTGDDMIQQIILRLNRTFRSPPEAKEQLLNLLHNQRLLLVLDNTEQNPDAGSVINELLRASGAVTLLVTSRISLNLPPGIEKVIEVPALSLSESRDMFYQVARNSGHELAWDLADVERICQRLEGVPLAIQLAASRVAGLDPNDMLEQLEQRFQFLQAKFTSEHPRQRALLASMEWSYQLLDKKLQKLFTRVSVFTGDFTSKDARQVCGPQEVLDGLQELRRHSLLTSPSTERFLMLESLQEYAKRRMSTKAREAAQERHAGYFLHFARDRISRLRTPEEAKAFHELEAALPNIEGAIRWCEAAPRPEWGSELALVAGRLLERRGFFSKAAEYIERGRESEKNSSPPDANLRAELLLERAGLHLDQKQLKNAQELANDARLEFQSAGNLLGETKSLNLLGIVCGEQKRFADAFDLFHQALQLLTDVENPNVKNAGRALVLTNLGRFKGEENLLEEAETHLTEALHLQQQLGDERGVAESATNLGIVLYRRGEEEQGSKERAVQHFRAAGDRYEEALRLERKLEHIYGIGRALFNLAEVADNIGASDRAYRLASVAEHLFEKIGALEKDAASNLRQRLFGNLTHSGSLFQVDPGFFHNKSLDGLITWAMENKEATDIGN